MESADDTGRETGISMIDVLGVTRAIAIFAVEVSIYYLPQVNILVKWDPTFLNEQSGEHC